MNHKIKVVKINLYRAEGRVQDCVAATATRFSAADAWLRCWSTTAPDDGSYHKCDFTIEWADGETYEGRYDLKKHDGSLDNLIGRHVRRFLEWQGGIAKDPWCGPAEYQEYLRQHTSPAAQAECRKFLKNYEIGTGAGHP